MVACSACGIAYTPDQQSWHPDGDAWASRGRLTGETTRRSCFWRRLLGFRSREDKLPPITFNTESSQHSARLLAERMTPARGLTAF